MAFDGEPQLIRLHADAVVFDENEIGAAIRHRNVDAPRAGIERVLGQFFHRARRAFHHFAGSDAVDRAFGETANGARGSGHPGVLRYCRARTLPSSTAG